MSKKGLTTKDLERVLPVLGEAFDVITEANLATIAPELPFSTLQQLGERFGIGLGDKPTIEQMSLLGKKINESNLPLESIEYRGLANSYIQYTDRLFPWASRREAKG